MNDSLAFVIVVSVCFTILCNETMENKINLSKINKDQKGMLIEFIKEHPEMQQVKFGTNFTYKKARKLWEEVSEILNA